GFVLSAAYSSLFVFSGEVLCFITFSGQTVAGFQRNAVHRLRGWHISSTDGERSNLLNHMGEVKMRHFHLNHRLTKPLSVP
ncbi:hypothetical protein, partial [Klebsiella indica]|uniref:hypothetical protein n=1 Tax=Klebsiella indica TaxID=2582917 RepID=UPI0031B729DD